VLGRNVENTGHVNVCLDDFEIISEGHNNYLTIILSHIIIIIIIN